MKKIILVLLGMFLAKIALAADVDKNLVILKYRNPINIMLPKNWTNKTA